ncbi:MFS transporter [Nocardiopsis lambiniae]|uniref:MFS transporter n=1 Tax=Nocardiopsis lambiniae TaxID=3075539 RepID=A0ABU2MB20_9ACTN|nr:MFS transporter [Nocardiopsis sp. DSM 44743]MDT0329785.1 MFS transporter [Nocardiopsis sp. DSM 44743]
MSVPPAPNEPGPTGTAGAVTGSVVAVVGLLVFFELTSGLLQGSITPLLPPLRDELDIPGADLHWIHAVQYLAAAVSVPVFGRLGDLYGYRRMLRVSLACIAVGSVIVAAAPTLGVLLVGRALLGPLAALLPLEIGLVRDRLSPEQGRKAIGMLVGSLTLGSLLGTLLVGVIQTVVGDVRVTLGLLAALAVGCLLLSYFKVPESEKRAPGRMDWAGGVLLGLALLSLLGGVSQGNELGWTSPLVIGGAVLAAVLLVLWVRVELRSENPLVDVRAVAHPRIAPQYLGGFTLGLIMLGGQSIAVTYLSSRPEETGYGFGLDVMSIGLVIAVPTVLAFVGASGIAPIATRLGYRRTVFASFALMAAGTLGLAAAWASLPAFVACFAVAGLGFGLALGALPTVIVEDSAEDRAGSAVAFYNNLKTLGGSVGGALTASLLGMFLIQGTDVPTVDAYRLVWAISAAMAVGTALLAVRAPREREAARA